MDEDLDYTFFKADGFVICVATAQDGVSFGVRIVDSGNPCTDRVKLIAMVHNERNQLTLKENN